MESGRDATRVSHAAGYATSLQPVLPAAGHLMEGPVNGRRHRLLNIKRHFLLLWNKSYYYYYWYGTATPTASAATATTGATDNAAFS